MTDNKPDVDKPDDDKSTVGSEELADIRRLEAELAARKKAFMLKAAAAKPSAMGNGHNKPLPPPDDERWVLVGEERRFVDIIIHDDYIIHCGEKYLRKDWSKADPADWRRQWEFVRQRHAARGPIATANVSGGSDMDAFRKLVQWKG